MALGCVHGEGCVVDGRPCRNFSVPAGRLVVPLIWMCCARFCIIALLDWVGELANGLLAEFAIGIREKQKKVTEEPRNVKEVDHEDPSLVVRNH